jgi:hypothetical protein
MVLAFRSDRSPKTGPILDGVGLQIGPVAEDRSDL